MAMKPAVQKKEYRKVRYFRDNTMHELAAEGWTVIPGTVASYDGNWYVLMEREV